MRIVVEELSSKGRDVRFTEADGWARSAAERVLEGVARDVKGNLHIERVRRGGVEVHVTAAAGVDRPCDRCGRDVALAVDADETLLYLPVGQDVKDEPESDEFAVGWYEGGEIDLDTVLGEALALNMPNRVVCPDEAACSHAMAAMGPTSAAPAQPANGGHPAFAVLKNLR